MKITPLKNTVVRVQTREEYNELMQLLEENGFKWASGDKPTTHEDYWNDLHSRTCIRIISREITFDSVAFEESKGTKIITLKQLKEKFSMYQAPKMKYKQGDILVNRNGSGAKKILAVVGEAYLLSSFRYHDEAGSMYTQHELDEMGYKLKTPDPEIIEVNGKKYNKADVEKRLAELEEAEQG